MKFLFSLLLLANLTFFLWEQFVRREPGNAGLPRQAEQPLDTLVLLRELPPPQMLAQPEQPPAEPAAPVTETPPPPAGDAAPVASPQAVAPDATPAAEAARPAEKREFCARLGPFPAEVEAQAAGNGIEGLRAARVESRVRPAESGYWVVRPPAASLDEAKAMKRRLMEQGAKEALILREGENTNAVSLGFFRDRTRAETLLRDYRARGFEGLEIRARRDGRTEYWLKVRARTEAAAWNATLERIRSHQPGLKVEERCAENGANRN